jgi:cytidine deaminase
MTLTAIPNKELEELVTKELRKCVAPISGIFVAAAIVTEEGVYFGNNIERTDPVVLEHGEMMALKEALIKEENPKIKKIVMAGGGKVNKFKFYTPCFGCSHSFLPYVTGATEIVLAPLTGVNNGLTITFGELWQSYSQLPYSKIGSTKNPELRAELSQKTVLNEKDLDFVSALALFGISSGISFYLTASASGRGGVSTMLNEKTGQEYRDIDLIAIITSNFEATEKEIELLIRDHYGVFLKEDKPVPAHHNRNGVVFKKSFYFCGPQKDKLLDFTFSTDLKGALAKNEYEVKNWFHQLS